MRSKIILIPFVMILVISCNLPILRNSISEDRVATKVSMAKTATMESQDRITPPPPSSPTQPGMLSKTVEPSYTPSPEPSITATSNDFASQLGAPYYSNPMSSGSAFGLDSEGYDDGYTRIGMADGGMVLTSNSTNGWRGWRLTDRGLYNFYLEGTFITGVCTGNDQYGLVFRAPDYSTGEGYYFGVTCDGNYSLLLSDGDRYRTLIELTPSDKIKQGSNQTNQLGVLAEGPSIVIFLNGEKIGNVNDSTFLTPTKVGAFILGRNTPGFTVKLDQLNMWAR